MTPAEITAISSGVVAVVGSVTALVIAVAHLRHPAIDLRSSTPVPAPAEQIPLARL